MDSFLGQLTEALTWTEEKAESVQKLTKLLKQCVQTYSDLTAAPSTNNNTPKKSTVESMELDKVLQGMAELWSRIPKGTRSDLIDPIQAEAGNNEALFVRGIFSQLILLASMTQPVANLSMMLGKVIKNQEKILKQLETINERLKAIEIRLDEQILIDARTAIIHLNDAANVQGQLARDQDLQLASGAFTKLTGLDPNLMTRGISNKALIALGYWGRHLIRGMQGETRYALVQVYECTQKYPLEGMMVFPPEYFSKDYKNEIDQAKSREAMARSQQSNAEKANQQAQIDRGLEMASGAGLVLLGIAALAVGNGSVIQAGLQALRGGSQVYNNASNKSANPYDILTPHRVAESMKATREKLTIEITTECSARLQLLRRIDVADLRKVINIPTTML